jgi:hypothetical protein
MATGPPTGRLILVAGAAGAAPQAREDLQVGPTSPLAIFAWPPKSGAKADLAKLRLRATSGLMHHSERVGLFVISSARASNDGGMEKMRLRNASWVKATALILEQTLNGIALNRQRLL